MRIFIAIAILSAAVFANASLKLSTQANFYDQGEATRPQAGLSLWHPLRKNVAVNLYTGVGVEPFEVRDDVTWITAKGQVDFSTGNWIISPGYAVKDIDGAYDSRSYGYLKVDYKLF